MDHYTIQRDIQSGKIAPVYTLMGEEPYFVDSITDFIEEHVLTEAEKDFNQTIVYGRDVSISQIISIAKGFPMMGDRQVVLVKEAQDIKEWKKAEELAPLEAYLTQPQPSTMLVFAFKNKKLDGRLKVAKQLAKVGVVFESKKIRDYQLPQWIKAYAESHKHAISDKAVHLMAEYLGSSLDKLANALDKLMIVVDKDKTIDLNDIENHVGISKDYNIFELQKAMAVKDVFKCNQIINYFDANAKAHPIQMILPMFYNFFSRVRAYQFVNNKHTAPKVLGVAPFQLKEVEIAASQFHPDKVERIIGYIRECDTKSKGVNNESITHGFLMKEMMFKILH
jgi:DNA polymerase III subunit delta